MKTLRAADLKSFVEQKLGPSETFLVLVNLVPVFGVLFLNWKVFDVFILYWMESAIMGLFGILKMIVTGIKCGPAGIVALLFFVPFFTLHYGAFMTGHLIFIFAITGTVITSAEPIAFGEFGKALLYTLPFALPLFVSHGYSFIVNFLGKEEYRRLNLSKLAFLPYGRIAIMHISIFVAFFALMVLRLPALAPILIIASKIFTDLRAHRKEHKKTPDKAPAPVGSLF